MNDSPTIPHLVAQKFSAKTTLNNLRTSDHELGRPLALCLMFETAENQIIAASIFELAIALDAALSIPKEALLAAIRIQWWVDALSKSTDQNVTLLAQLQVQFQTRHELQPQLQEMASKWCLACYNEDRNSAAGWAEAWRIVAIQLGHLETSEQAAQIGISMHYKTRRHEDVKHSASINSIDIKALKKNDQGELRSWLYMVACLNLRLHNDLTNRDSKSAYRSFDDPTLIWRILGWHFFGPPR